MNSRLRKSAKRSNDAFIQPESIDARRGPCDVAHTHASKHGSAEVLHFPIYASQRAKDMPSLGPDRGFNVVEVVALNQALNGWSGIHGVEETVALLQLGVVEVVVHQVNDRP